MKKIGEKFVHKGVRLITEECDECLGCHFYDEVAEGCVNKRFHCIPKEREDEKSVIFRKIIFKFGK